MTTDGDPPSSAHHGRALMPLVQASQACDFRAVSSALKSASREQVSGQDSTGRTALHALAQSSATAEPPEPACGCFGSPPVQDPCTAIAEALLAAGGDPDAQDNEGCTPLMVACSLGREPVIEALLARSSMKVVNNLGETTLMVALRGPNTEGLQLSVQRMLKTGAPANLAAKDGQTALMYAAVKGRIKAVTALLEDGASPNVVDLQGRTPLSLSVAGKYGPVSAALVEAGAFDPQSTVVNQKVGKGGQTQLHVACARSNAERVTELLANKAILTTSDDNGQRALHLCQETTCAALLLEKGADVNATDNARNTVLHLAARRGLTPLVRLLLENGAKSNVHNVHGSTPLHSALEGLCKTSEHKDDKACLDICTMLLDNGADANAQDGGGYQPHDRAHKVTVTGNVTSASTEIIELLKSRGARLSLTFQCELDISPAGRMTLLTANGPTGGGAGGGGSMAVRSKSPNGTAKSPSMSMARMHVGRGSMTVNKVSPYGGSLRGSAPAQNRLEMIFGGRTSARDEAPPQQSVMLARGSTKSPSNSIPGSRRGSTRTSENGSAVVVAAQRASENGQPVGPMVLGSPFTRVASEKTDATNEVRRFSVAGEPPADGDAATRPSQAGDPREGADSPLLLTPLEHLHVETLVGDSVRSVA